MSKINLYPNILSVSGTDILTASDVSKPGIPTKTVTVDQLTSFVSNAIENPTPEEKTITLDLGPLTNSNIGEIISTLFKIDPTGGAVIEPYGKIGDWDVSGVTDMGSLFSYRRQFNQDISKWDVSNVTNMYRMFNGTNYFNQDISDWDVSSVTSMESMFYSATLFNQDISDWDVSSVTSMQYMFYDATLFNQDISDWDVSSVTSMNSMFRDATLFNKDLSGWDVDQVEYYNYFSIHAYNWTLSKPNFTFI